MAVVKRIAQAVIAEAEPHRRRFPNFACGRLSRSPAPRWPLRGALPPAAGQGMSEPCWRHGFGRLSPADIRRFESYIRLLGHPGFGLTQCESGREDRHLTKRNRTTHS